MIYIQARCTRREKHLYGAKPDSRVPERGAGMIVAVDPARPHLLRFRL
jgi:hypothetical protein